MSSSRIGRISVVGEVDEYRRCLQLPHRRNLLADNCIDISHCGVIGLDIVDQRRVIRTSNDCRFGDTSQHAIDISPELRRYVPAVWPMPCIGVKDDDLA